MVTRRAAFLSIWLAIFSASSGTVWGQQKSQNFGQFLDQLDVRLIAGGKIELLQDFRYRGPDRVLWTAPKGMISDGASIPRIFLWMEIIETQL